MNKLLRDTVIFFLLFLSVRDLTCCGAQEVADVPDQTDTSPLTANEILLKIFDRTGGFGWTSRKNWMEDDVCTYEGIACYQEHEDYAGHIREVDLADNGLVGTMPADLFRLPYLETVIVRDNADLYMKFDNLAEAQHLKHLVISGTHTDTLEGIEGGAASLETLHITNLGLTGPLPSAVYQLTNLRGLFANFNSFSGALSTEIGNLFFLTDLYLFENNLEGPIPTEIGKLVNLQTLSLGDNAWGGSLPTELDLLVDLRTLAIQRSLDNLKGTGLSGNVLDLSSMPNLNSVDLSNQRLSGNLPSNFLEAASEDKPLQVNLRGNQITGEIPSALVSKASLSLYLADNQISGLTPVFCNQVPQWMGAAVGAIGCQAILCPPGTYNPVGRREHSQDSCDTCATATFFGATTCAPPMNSGQFERDALIKFFDQMGGQYWKTSTNWLSPAVDICSWFGISCNADGQVIAIRLRNNDLTKTPPPEIFSLPELRVLDLAENTLDFSFVGIENASQLQTLDLTQTDLKAVDGIDGLQQTQIRSLALGSNILAGALPSAVFGLSNLEELDLSHNFLQGELSGLIGNLIGLQRLYLFGNAFNGQLPTELGQLNQLVELKAGENSFSGSLPQQLNNLEDLEILSLHQTTTSQAIGGSLPAYDGLRKLSSLQLAGNALAGTLPPNFLANTLRGSEQMEILLGDNLLSGEIPAEWAGRFDNLVLDLTGNLITGFGSGICDSTGWMNGNVGLYSCNAILCPSGTFNEFGRQSTSEGICRDCNQANVLGAKACGTAPATPTGEEIDYLQELFDATHGNSWTQSDGWKSTSDFCTWFGISCNSSSRVTKISLPDNNLSGTPPSSIFKLESLQELDLGQNQITFSFQGIEAATSLNKLVLSSTNLNSVTGLDSAISLLELEMDDNDIGGSLPAEFLALTGLRRLSLNFNNIEGRIPADISSLKLLEELSFFHNRLTGQLPAAIGSLSNLRVLALSENNFDGTVPPSFNSLVKLETLAIQREGGTDGSPGNVGVDHGGSDDEGGGLSGPLPAFDKLSNLRQLYLGVNSFSGNVPTNFLGGVTDENAEIVVDLTSNLLNGGIPGALARFEKLTIFLAGNRLTEEIPSGICRQAGWMKGQVGTLGCEAILCPLNHAAPFGRRTDSADCVPCDGGESSLFLGSFDCQTSHAGLLEFDILQELYQQTNGDSWSRNDYWLDPDVSICSWYGITCDAGAGESVVSIQLVQNGLTGRVPTSIYQLSNLRELSLAENDADISFMGIGNVQNLEYLDVNSMSLSSLAGLGQASSLLQLHIASNNLGPRFPAELLPLTNIEVLDVSFNPLGENIPAEGSGWSNLRSFSCERCGFVGFIPPVVASWTQLKYLNLADNDYNGVFPIEIESLSNLEYLDVSKQKSENSIGLSGFLPSFGSAPNLQEVYLQDNDFFGEIPANFLASTNTQDIVVDVRQNRLNGTLPFRLQRFSDGVFLFADNQLGGVPGPLCSLGWNDQPTGNSECDYVLCPVGTYNGIGRATSFLPCTPCASAIYWGTTGCGNVEREVLRGLFYGMEGSQWLHNDGWGSHTSVCDWYGVTCYTEGVHSGLVQKLDLRGNNVVGTLDSSIWQLTAMVELDLSDNSIQIESFQGIEDAALLETLKLSNNQVDALDGIHMASATLRNFHCTSCEIYGPFPVEFFTLSNLQRLYLNYNYLSGPVTGMKDMSSLVEIYLFSNELTGELPFPLIGSRFVEVISIGHNRLNGTIPATYNVLPALRVFSAEHEGSSTLPVDEEFGFKDQGLIGPVPSFAYCPALREVYLAGNGLGGQIPQDFLGSVTDVAAPIHIDISNNFIAGTLPAGLAKFDDMRLLASNNLIQAIPPSICDKSAWMDGLLASGCDALLCPKGTFSEVGRRTTSSSCEPCDYRGAAVFMGTTKCGPLDNSIPERDVLVEFFETAEGPIWKDKTGWNTTAPLCQWFGVSCENIGGVDSVTGISLRSNGLSNRVGSIIFSLPNLRVLDISDNLVEMTFRDAFRAATNLEELDVSNTGVSSAEGIGGAKSLRKLIMGRNIFTGQEIPGEIYSLTKLTHLDLSYSGLMGTLSEEFSRLSALLYMDLGSNDLVGSIPTSLGSLAKLQRLDLSENLLHGELPSSFSGLSSLESLYLSARTRPTVGLSGQLPTLDGLRNLRYVDLGANSLTGTVPPNLLSGLESFNEQVTVLLDSNILHGTIPLGLNRFSRLSIDLADNEIEGIAGGLCSMTLWWDGDVARHQCDAILCPPGTFNVAGRQDSPDNRCEECPGSGGDQFYGRIRCPALQKAASKKILEDLYSATGGSSWKRRNNWLTHPNICVWEGITCSSDGVGVETVNLGSNNLSGRPPKEIFELLGLKNLWLFSNPIDFSFEGIENAQTLVNLQLDSVGLRNLDGIGQAPSLTYLDVRFNALEGVISSEIDGLSSLQTLLISDNSLYGPLPTFSSNRRLTTLKAGGNAFTGPLPSFSVHPNLRQLDVTGNQLNGEIPNDLLANVDSSTPVLLYLSSNKFSGILPPGLARFNDLTIFVNDNEITGIAAELCEQDTWNGGDVERFGCDGILCPPRSFAPKGRATSESGDCVACDSASFFGHSVCVSSEGVSTLPSWYSTMALLVVSTVLAFMC